MVSGSVAVVDGAKVWRADEDGGEEEERCLYLKLQSIPKSSLPNLDGWRSKKAILRRGCHKWPVDTSDGEVFGDGWRKFVVDNGVQELDFIVFKHHGNMVFDLFVFDPSTCERQYLNLSDEVEDSLPEYDSLHTDGKLRYVVPSARRLYYVLCCRQNVVLVNKCIIIRILQTVPIKFARSNRLTTRRMYTQVVLVDEAKSTWPATLHIKTDKVQLMGWCNLIIANGLRVGDKCMFELVKAGEVPVFNLFSTHLSICSQYTSFYLLTNRDMNSDLAKKPTINHIQHLPAEFSRSNGLRMGEMILRDDNGRSWKVQLNKLGDNRLYLGCGFRDFMIGNGLREGDAYKFELLENEKDKPPIVNFSFLGKKAIKDHIQLQETRLKIKEVIGSTLVKKENDKPPVVKGDWFNSCNKSDY
ncbi:B3 domain-containing protein REM14-like [Bidens hawaiensis]|uniref:B3 domain-containing protein REM14-like n=1 Tax=Bidens hawaiensis TaxID=980011 RepID=UPI00404B0D7A